MYTVMENVYSQVLVANYKIIANNTYMVGSMRITSVIYVVAVKINGLCKRESFIPMMNALFKFVALKIYARAKSTLRGKSKTKLLFIYVK